MGIRIKHGQVSTYAQLGVLAGRATAEREAVERQAAMDRQVLQIQAQRASQERTQAHQIEMREFDAYMDNIRYQSAEAWELEKMELHSRHDFEMAEAKREMDFQSQMQREQRQQQEMDTKIKAINEAEHLSPAERENAILKVQTGVTIPRRTGQPVNWMQEQIRSAVGSTPSERRAVGEAPALDPEVQAARERATREVGAGVQQQALRAETERKSKELRTILPELDSSTSTELKSILERGNPVEIDKAYRILGERVNKPEKLRYQKFAFGGF